VIDESALPGARHGHLAELLAAAGLQDVEQAVLEISVEQPSFEAWWDPFTRGVGPGGAYVASRSVEQQIALRERCRALLPAAPFVLSAAAWAARGRI
jgi:hypothetical protein